MQALVSMEALQDVKKALTGFSADISGIALRIEKRVNETLDWGMKCVAQAESDVNLSFGKEKALSQELSAITVQLSAVRDEYQQCLSQIDFLTGKIDGIRNEISCLSGELASARSQRQGAMSGNDQGGANPYNARINALEMQIGRLESECQALTARKSAEDNRRRSLYTQQQSLSSREQSCRENLDSERRRLMLLEGKRDRLKHAYWNMEKELQAYVTAARMLEYSSGSMTGRNISAVDACIRSIEKYLNTNI